MINLMHPEMTTPIYNPKGCIGLQNGSYRNIFFVRKLETPIIRHGGPCTPLSLGDLAGGPKDKEDQAIPGRRFTVQLDIN